MRLIDADALIEKLDAEPEGGYYSPHDVISLLMTQRVVEERKKGKWINHRNDMGHNIADCSECGEAMQWYDPDTRPNYCPNCGARMKI